MRPLLVLALLAASAAVARAEVMISVDAFTGYALNRQAEISANLFGFTAFEGFPSVVADPDYRARVAALRPGCIRFSSGGAWFGPKDYDPAWYDTPEAARQFEQTLLFGARYPLGRFCPIVRNLGAEPMASLGPAPKYLAYKDTPRPADFDRWAADCTALVGLWRKFDPHLRLVQIWNEPNADWWQDDRTKGTGVTATQLHIEMANKVAAALKQRFADLQVGGPVLCWPPAWPANQQGQKPWYTWEQWTLPWLKATKDTVDFYDFHVYDVTPDDFAVQTEMLANQAQLTQGRDLPVWITESNYSLKDEELRDPAAVWTRRVLPYERFMMYGVLPQSDKVAGNLVHDLHARSFTILPRGADDPDPMYWLLWILRDLRGRRIVADSSDPHVPVFATLEEDRVTIVAFNDTDTPQPVRLRVSMPAGWWTGPEVRVLGPNATTGCEKLSLPVEVKRDGGRAEATLTLPAHATISISFRLDAFRPQLWDRFVSRRELFGDRTLQFIQADAPVRVALKYALSYPGQRVWLRVGLLGAEPTDTLTARLNGQEVPLQPRALQDLPLDPPSVKATNALEVQLKQPGSNPRLALAFASLVVETLAVKID